MRIKRLTAENFGKFERFAVNLRSNFVVFSGQNEAGKTTLFELIGLLLFGAPLAEDREKLSELIRRGYDKARLTGVFETQDVGTLSLARSIDADSTNLIQADADGEQVLGEAAAPLIQHLSKPLFESIYSLDYRGMATLSEDVWESIQHRIMGTGTAPYLKSVDEALNDLSDQAGELWRLDNFQGQRLRELKNKKKTQEIELDIARQRQRDLLDKQLLLDQTKEEIGSCENRIDFEKAFLKEAQRMNALRDNINQIKELEKESPRITELKKWMPNIRGEYHRLKDRCDSIESQLNLTQRNLDEWTQHQQASPQIQRILDAAPEIESLTASIDIDNQVNKIAVEKYNQAQFEWRSLLDELLVDADEPSAIAALDKIDNLFLNQRLRSLHEARAQHGKLSWELEALCQPKEKTTSLGLVGVLCALLLLVGAGIAFVEPLAAAVPALSLQAELVTSLPFSPIITGGGVGLLSLVIFTIAVVLKGDGKRKKQTEALQQQISQSLLKIDDIIDDAHELLAGLSIPRERLETSDRRLESDIRRLQDALDKVRMLQNEIEAPSSLETPSPAVSRPALLAEDLLGQSSGDDEQDIADLKSALKDALDNPHRNDDQIGIIERNQEDVARLSAELELAEAELKELSDLLGENPEEEIARLEQLQSELDKAHEMRSELMNTVPNYKDVAARLNTMNQNGWPYSPESIEACNARIGELEEQKTNLYSTSGALENGIEHLQNEPSPRMIQSKIMFIDSEIASLSLRHDQLVLAAALLRVGNERFSRLNQPKVLKRAGEYLSMMTGGQYDKMGVSEDRQRLIVRDMDGTFMEPGPSRLSQATREQIYLSLRLSLIDSFDEEHEPLPIFLDEALITWDEARLSEAITLLDKLSETHQVVLFTCHDWLVSRIIDQVSHMQLVEL